MTFPAKLAALFLIPFLSLGETRAADAPAVHFVAPDSWRTPDPASVAIAVENDPDPARATAHFDIRTPQAGAWTLLTGPEITLGPRTPFHKNRRVHITLEARTTGLDGYAMQIRIRQRSGAQTTGGAFTRNLSPRREWSSSLEMARAENYQTWAELAGSSTVGFGTERLALELWLTTPYGKTPATITLRNIRVTEEFEIEHTLTTTVPGNIFFADTGSVKAGFVDPQNLRAARIELFDETKTRVGLVEGKPGTATLTAPLVNRGYYTVHASADYADGKDGKLINKTITATTTAAVVGPQLDDTVRRASRFGSMKVWGDRDTWLRTGFNWDWGIGGINLADYKLNPDGTVSPPPGLKPLSYASNYKDILTIGEFPKWVMPAAYTGSSLMPPKDWELFERLFEAFAKQNPDLPWFCPFNEPDAHWRGSKADFVKFHHAIVRGVKRGNPAMKVYGPGCYSIRMTEFREYAKMGLLDGMEGIVMHGYVNASEPEGKFIENFVELAAFLKETGRGDLPVFITEYGWCAEIGDWQKTITELERSQYAPRSLALLATQPLDNISYFCFKHASEPGRPGYSLLYMDNTPTPTYTAVVNAMKWLAWTQRGEGRWFRLSPALHFTLFARDEGGVRKNTGVAWNATGPATLALPAVPARLESSMGRVIPVRGQAVLDVSPAPVYFELPDAVALALSNARTLPAQSFAPGTKFDLPWQASNILTAPEITVTGRHAIIAPDAAPGNYEIVAKTGDSATWQVLPVRILEPLQVEAVDFTLAPDGKQLLAIARVQTPIKNGANVRMTLTLKNGQSSTQQLRLAPGIPARIETPIPGFKIGQRFQGEIMLTPDGLAHFARKQEFDQTFILCPTLPRLAADAEAIWRTVPGVDFSAWNPHPGPITAADCSAILKTLVTPDAFHLHVEVTDNIHHQNQLPSYMWNGDSIQFAFDVDADKPWQPNNVGNGYQGHRIFEYGVGLPTKGEKAMVWRWRADAPGFSSSSEEPRIVAAVERSGSRTLYDVILPWPVLGLKTPPPPGANIGFSLVVNDMDGSADTRHALRIFGGVLENKDPKNFGKLHVSK